MAHQNHHQTPQHPPPVRQNPFPVATSIAPVIFTPISGDDLIAPFNPPSDRILRLNSKITFLNDNYKQVRANIIAFMRRECSRILWDAMNEANHLKAAGNEDKVNEIGTECVTEDQLDYMIERMTNEGQGNGMERQVEIPNFDALCRKEGISFREKYTLAIEKTISQGLYELAGYESEVEKLRNHYKDLLHKEWDREKMNLD